MREVNYADTLIAVEPGWQTRTREGTSGPVRESTREEKASIATGSNVPFSEWGSIIRHPRLVAAIVDQLTFHAHIIETATESYRLRTTRASKGRRAK